MRPIRFAHYVTDSEVLQYGIWGMPMVYYVISHDLFVMHPRVVPEFEKMMWSVGMEVALFGGDNG